MTKIQDGNWRITGGRIVITCPACGGDTFLDDYVITIDGSVHPKYECMHEGKRRGGGGNRRKRCLLNDWIFILGWPLDWQKRRGKPMPERVGDSIEELRPEDLV